MTDVFEIVPPRALEIPVVLSVPHCGSYVPANTGIKPDLLPPDDTDWFVDRLYAFAAELGATTLSATHNRWIIDLNRNPDNTALYDDGRVITGLCPTTDFRGTPIYEDERTFVEPGEVGRRKRSYFDPYHEKLQQLLNEKRARFGFVLLVDCHSIRRLVPSIRPLPFPDLILGTADGQSAAERTIGAALSALAAHGHTVQHNDPFKGGYITRHYGQPHNAQHALQLELSKDLYMDDSETSYDEARARKLVVVLKRFLQDAMSTLTSRP